MIERRYQTTELRVEPKDNQPHIVGYAAVFNSRSNDLGGFREFISPGAFARTLKDQPDVRALYDHNSGAVLGRTKAGTMTLGEDQRGLFCDITPPDTETGRSVVESIRRGDIDGMSFGFCTVSDNWGTEDGMPLRELVDLDLIEVSCVAFPAYPDTAVAVRSLATWKTIAAAPDFDSAHLASLRRKLQLASI
jgi:uncharacterized protein